MCQKSMRALRRDLRSSRYELEGLKEQHDDTLQNKEDADCTLRCALNQMEKSKTICQTLEQYKDGWGKKVKVVRAASLYSFVRTVQSNVFCSCCGLLKH